MPAETSISDQRVEIARYVLSLGMEPADYSPDRTPVEEGVAAAQAALKIAFPDGLAPTPQPLDPAPAPDAALPHADIVVITWTVDEVDALADVLTPGYPRNAWYRYDRFFAERYLPQIRAGAPALQARRLASYFPTTIGPHSVLCMKSELHLNKDGIPDPAHPGTASLPVKDLFEQIISEAQPKLLLTVGTSGSVYEKFGLGDVVVTRGAKFRLAKEFKNAAFNNQTYTSDWAIPTEQIATAEQLMQFHANKLAEPPVRPPTKTYEPALEAKTPANASAIRLDGRDMPEFHPILTTDYFEYGTTSNGLDKQGAAVEMGDAVLGLVCSELSNPPKWGVIRNMSDPCINGDLPAKDYLLNEQTMWAVGYYAAYGYWTSVNGALATWAVIAGIAPDGLA